MHLVRIDVFSFKYAGSGVPGGGGSNSPSKFQRFVRADPNSQVRGKYIRNNPIRIRVSFIRKLSGTHD
jgi:hypothetical protein